VAPHIALALRANTLLGPFSTAQELSLALNRNELSAEELLMATVERIDAINPTVNAIVAIDADAARKGQERVIRGALQTLSADRLTA
jgi:Asp-tRNA(Asn)/Glu-tRNA(Gln) amidotransferase A subunit family amidase